MIESIRSQDSGAFSSSTDFTRGLAQAERVTQGNAASALAETSLRFTDRVQLSEESQKELRELKQRDREVRNQRSESANTQSTFVLVQRPAASTQRENQTSQTSPQTSQDLSASSQKLYTVQGNQTSSEAFLATSRLFSDAQPDTSISWANGTYHTGKVRSAAYGFMQNSQDFTAQSSLSVANRMQHAQRTYAMMSTQGIIPTALAPSGTGISLRV